MSKVKCADCECYKLFEGITDEPKGACMNDDPKVIPPVYAFMYEGRNWRLNQRNSDTLRYCKGFTPRGQKAKVWVENEE